MLENISIHPEQFGKYNDSSDSECWLSDLTCSLWRLTEDSFEDADLEPSQGSNPSKSESDSSGNMLITVALKSLNLEATPLGFLTYLNKSLKSAELKVIPVAQADGSRTGKDVSRIEFSEPAEKTLLNTYTDRHGNKVEISIQDGTLYHSSSDANFEISADKILRKESETQWHVNRITKERVLYDGSGNPVFKFDQGLHQFHLGDGTTATNTNKQWCVYDRNNKPIRKASIKEQLFILSRENQELNIHFIADPNFSPVSDGSNPTIDKNDWYCHNTKGILAHLENGTIFQAIPDQGFFLKRDNLKLWIKPTGNFLLQEGENDVNEIVFDQLPTCFKNTGDSNQTGSVLKNGTIELGNGIRAIPEQNLVDFGYETCASSATQIILNEKQGIQIKDRTGATTSQTKEGQFVTTAQTSSPDKTARIICTFDTKNEEFEANGITAAPTQTIFSGGDRMDRQGNIFFANGDTIRSNGEIAFADGGFFGQDSTIHTPDGFSYSLNNDSQPGSQKHAESFANAVISMAEAVASKAAAGKLDSGDLACLVSLLGQIAHLKVFVTEAGNPGVVCILSRAEALILEKLKSPNNPGCCLLMGRSSDFPY